jgi:D-3-phosphoglycerate dehydrogenase
MHDVLVTDSTFADLAIETAILEPLGCTVRSRQCKTVEELVPEVPGADFVITQFAPVNAAVIAAMNRAKVIVRYGIGVDNVDLDAARARGIPVCNVPDYCIDEVADHTLAFLLGTTRQVVPNTLAVRSGQWRLAVPLAQMRTLRELTVGVVGFGRIGRAVAARLVPFGGRILVHDPLVDARAIEQLGLVPAELPRLLAESDAITLHLPSTTLTRKMINARAIEQMKPGVLLVNLSRGDLVDTPALIDALKRGHVAAAALDVCDPEPIPAGNPLLAMPNVILSSHVASASATAVRALRTTAAELVARCVRGERPINVVNGA